MEPSQQENSVEITHSDSQGIEAATHEEPTQSLRDNLTPMEPVTQGADTTSTPCIPSRTSSAHNLSRRTLSTIPAAKPDGFWFRREAPFHPRYTLPTSQGPALSRGFRVRQNIVSFLLSLICYALLMFTLPVIALILWSIFRQQTGGVVALPGEDTSGSNSTLGSLFGE